MSVPTPPVTLEGHCSIIHNNILYVYTSEAFLSLPLQVNGTWQELSQGQAVTGAVCLKGGTEGDNNRQSLYVVGGKTNSSDYSGLQRYSFDDAQWETIGTPGTSLENRTNHGAAYINSTSSIVVYAGSQDGSTALTTSTFLVSTVSPFEITSLNSQSALPMVSPVLLPWDESSAALLGGNSSTTSVFLFNSTTGWQDSGSYLAQALPDNVKCALVSGSDGSKVLETFDMSTSPNTVTRVALLDAGGVNAPAGQLVGTPSASSAAEQTSATKTRRSLTLADYPVYNDTFASTVTRSSFSLAQDGNGLVVISGGSETDPLCVFDSSTNRWLNTTKIFHGDEVQQALNSASSTSSASSSATSTAAATTTAVSSASAASSSTASSTSTSSSRTGTIIGATLGSILGFAALLIVILLILRWLRLKKEKAAGKGQNGQIQDKDRLSFQDRGIEPLARSAVPMARGPVPSADSYAIMAGHANTSRSLTTPTTSQHNLFTEKTRSPLGAVMSDRTESTPSPLSPSERSWLDGPPPGDRTTDEGWSKYFAGNKVSSLVDINSRRSTASSDQTQSDYRNSAWPPVTSGLAPLNLGILDDRTPLGRVNTGSPSTEHPDPSKGLFVQEGQSARISSADSASFVSDDADYDQDAYSSGIPASITEERGWPRPPSSNYTNSVYASTFIRDTLVAPSRSASHSQRNDPNRAKARVSSTVIPEQYPYDDPQTRNNINSDMSWLNLNAGH